MNVHLARPLLAVAALLVFAGAPPARSQDPQSAFQDRVDVRIVNVEVQVTDKKGRPVQGLTREDFELFEDDRPVEIQNFFEVAEGRVTAPAPVGQAPSAPTQPAVGPSGEPLTLIVFIDNTSLVPPHRNRVLDEVAEFLRGLSGPNRRFLLVTFDPGLRLHTPLTSEVGEVIGALDGVARMAAPGIQAAVDRQGVMRDIQSTFELAGAGGACVENWDRLTALVELYAQTVAQRVGRVQAGLLRLTRSVGGLPGRKAILYMSDGLEQIPGVDLFAYLGELCTGHAGDVNAYGTRFDTTRLFHELTAIANAHRVTFHALDTAGLRPGSSGSVEFASADFAPSPRNDHLRTANLQNSMFVMADETGGRTIFNANQPDLGLASIARDIGNYYSLGFAPAQGWDGRGHSLRLRLKEGGGKGVELRYRRRYQAVTEEERPAERTLATLVLGLEENPLGAEVELGQQESLEGGPFKVPLRISLPVDRLTLLPEGEARKGRMRVLIVAEDDRGRQTPMREMVVPLQLPPPGADPSPRHLMVIQLKLEAGRHTLGIGIEDQIGGVASFLRATVDAGSDQ